MVSILIFATLIHGLILYTSVEATLNVIFDVKLSIGQYSGAGEIVENTKGERCLIITQVYKIDGCDQKDPTKSRVSLVQNFNTPNSGTKKVSSAFLAPLLNPRDAFVGNSFGGIAWMQIRCIRVRTSGGYLVILFKFSEFCNFKTTVGESTYYASAELVNDFCSSAYVIANKLDGDERNFDTILGGEQASALTFTAIYPTGFLQQTNIDKTTNWFPVTVTSISGEPKPSTILNYSLDWSLSKIVQEVVKLRGIHEFKILVSSTSTMSTTVTFGLVTVDKSLGKQSLGKGIPLNWDYLLLFYNFVADGKSLSELVRNDPKAIISFRINRCWWLVKRVTQAYNLMGLSDSYALVLDQKDRQILFWILPKNTSIQIVIGGTLLDEQWEIVIESTELVWEVGDSKKTTKLRSDKSKNILKKYAYANSGNKFGITWSRTALSFSKETWNDISVAMCDLENPAKWSIRYSFPLSNFI